MHKQHVCKHFYFWPSWKWKHNGLLYGGTRNEWRKIDLFDIKLRLGVSRSHSGRNKSTVLNVLTLRILKGAAAPILTEVTIENRSTTLNRLNYPVNREACKVQNLLQPFEVGNYHLLVISSANNRKNYQFHSLTVFHSMSKDGRKMSPMHVTLKAGVNYVHYFTLAFAIAWSFRVVVYREQTPCD